MVVRRAAIADGGQGGCRSKRGLYCDGLSSGEVGDLDKVRD